MSVEGATPLQMDPDALVAALTARCASITPHLSGWTLDNAGQFHMAAFYDEDGEYRFSVDAEVILDGPVGIAVCQGLIASNEAGRVLGIPIGEKRIQARMRAVMGL